MRQVIDGNGSDSTAATAAWLAANNQLWLRNLYLIGDPDDPMALWLTDHESPLLWSAWGAFYPAAIERGAVSSKIGLDISSLDVRWSPKYRAYTQNITGPGASPYVRARLGLLDSVPFRTWTCYMPTPGDANTLGASELFGGRVAKVKPGRGKITFTINSFLDVVNQQVPLNVIEVSNTLAAYKGATPPAGFSVIPTFSVVAPLTTKTIVGNTLTPTPNYLFATNTFQFGFLVMTSGTLKGTWSAIAENYDQAVGLSHYNGFVLYADMPWEPAVGDTFYVSAAFPLNQADGEYVGFPFVPVPDTSLAGG